MKKLVSIGCSIFIFASCKTNDSGSGTKDVVNNGRSTTSKDIQLIQNKDFSSMVEYAGVDAKNNCVQAVLVQRSAGWGQYVQYRFFDRSCPSGDTIIDPKLAVFTLVRSRAGDQRTDGQYTAEWLATEGRENSENFGGSSHRYMWSPSKKGEEPSEEQKRSQTCANGKQLVLKPENDSNMSEEFKKQMIARNTICDSNHIYICAGAWRDACTLYLKDGKFCELVPAGGELKNQNCRS